jgi:hypothetical protein
MNIALRFEQKYIPEPNSGCWLWIGAAGPNKGTRPMIGTEYAARVSWKLHKGPIPPGLKILHKCDVSLCVNPDHLFVGTQLDNVRDMDAKGRRNVTHMIKFSDRDVWEVKQLKDHVSQRKLAKAYGMSVAYVCQLQRGRYR